jgi:protein SOK2
MYGHAPYVKSEMGPPSARTGAPNGEQVDSKPVNGMMHNAQGEVVSATGAEEEADHEHDPEYTHNSGGYETNRGSYNYSAPAVTSIQNDHSHLSPEMSGSPHQAGSGRATPRTAAAPQSYYSSQGYTTPPRVGQTSSNLYSVMSNERGSTNGTSTNDVYGNQGDMNGSMQNGYSTQPPILNGGTSMKRGRDDDDDRSDLKRRKGMLDGPGSMPSPTFNNQMAQPAAAVGAQRRR